MSILSQTKCMELGLKKPFRFVIEICINGLDKYECAYIGSPLGTSD